MSELRREPKCGPFAGRAAHADLTAHPEHELFANREPEPGAAVAPRGGSIRLAERLKEHALHLRINPDAGVLHFKTNSDSVRGIRVRILEPA